ERALGAAALDRSSGRRPLPRGDARLRDGASEPVHAGRLLLLRRERRRADASVGAVPEAVPRQRDLSAAHAAHVRREPRGGRPRADRLPPAERDPPRRRHAARVPRPSAARRRSRSGSRARPAGALLFAVHPIHAEAVAAVVGRAELLSTGLVLGAWLLHLADRRGAAAASFFLALLAKEPAVAFLALAPLGDRVRGRPIRPSRYWPYAAAFAGYLVLRWLAVGAPAMDRLAELENPLLSLPQPWRALNALVVAWRYVVLQIFPAT